MTSSRLIALRDVLTLSYGTNKHVFPNFYEAQTFGKLTVTLTLSAYAETIFKFIRAEYFFCVSGAQDHQLSVIVSQSLCIPISVVMPPLREKHMANTVDEMFIVAVSVNLSFAVFC